MAEARAMVHNEGINSSSRIGEQAINFDLKKAIQFELKDDLVYGQFTGTEHLRKNVGKEIKLFHMYPVLDDRNINDLGISADGEAIKNAKTIILTVPGNVSRYFVGYSANKVEADAATEATAAAEAKVLAAAKLLLKTFTGTTYAALKTFLADAAYVSAGWVLDDSNPVVPAFGNIYGSTRNIGTIRERLPRISETGGRRNRFGYKRRIITGRIHDFGIFMEYTQDSIMFDNDTQLEMHITREALRAAYEIDDDLTQIALQESAGVTMYGGSATQMSEVTGEGATVSALDYRMLIKLKRILDDNHSALDTTVVSGSAMTDTKTIQAARTLIIHPDLEYDLEKMLDIHGKPALVRVHQYAAAEKSLKNEIGSIGAWRFITSKRAMVYEGAGAKVTDATTVYANNGANYTVYPILYVGKGALSLISFAGGAAGRFEIKHKKPGEITHDDPYGKVGIYSIQWWHGHVVKRREWVAILNVVATAR